MSYLLDSDWCIDYLRGRTEAITLLEDLQHEGLEMSLVTYAELYEGIYFGSDRPAAERVLRQLLQFVTVLPLDLQIMERFAILRGELRRQGLMIGDLDAMIAATALHHNLTLVTRNARHFTRVPGLQLHQSQ